MADLFGGGGGMFGGSASQPVVVSGRKSKPKKKEKSILGKTLGLADNFVDDVADAAAGFFPGMKQIGDAIISDAGELVGMGDGEFDLDDIGKATLDAVTYTYEPLAKGDFDEFRRRVYEHPLGPVLDAFTIVTLGSGGSVRGAKALTDASQGAAAVRKVTGGRKVKVDTDTFKDAKTFLDIHRSGQRMGNRKVGLVLDDEHVLLPSERVLAPKAIRDQEDVAPLGKREAGDGLVKIGDYSESPFRRMQQKAYDAISEAIPGWAEKRANRAQRNLRNQRTNRAFGQADRTALDGNDSVSALVRKNKLTPEEAVHLRNRARGREDASELDQKRSDAWAVADEDSTVDKDFAFARAVIGRKPDVEGVAAATAAQLAREAEELEQAIQEATGKARYQREFKKGDTPRSAINRLEDTLNAAGWRKDETAEEVDLNWARKNLWTRDPKTGELHRFDEGIRREDAATDLALRVDEYTPDIAARGFDDPILIEVDERGRKVVVDGAARMLAAERAGHDAIPVTMLDGPGSAVTPSDFNIPTRKAGHQPDQIRKAKRRAAKLDDLVARATERKADLEQRRRVMEDLTEGGAAKLESMRQLVNARKDRDLVLPQMQSRIEILEQLVAKGIPVDRQPLINSLLQGLKPVADQTGDTLRSEGVKARTVNERYGKKGAKEAEGTGIAALEKGYTTEVIRGVDAFWERQSDDFDYHELGDDEFDLGDHFIPDETGHQGQILGDPYAILLKSPDGKVVGYRAGFIQEDAYDFDTDGLDETGLGEVDNPAGVLTGDRVFIKPEHRKSGGYDLLNGATGDYAASRDSEYLSVGGGERIAAATAKRENALRAMAGPDDRFIVPESIARDGAKRSAKQTRRGHVRPDAPPRPDATKHNTGFAERFALDATDPKNIIAANRGVREWAKTRAAWKDEIVPAMRPVPGLEGIPKGWKAVPKGALEQFYENARVFANEEAPLIFDDPQVVQQMREDILNGLVDKVGVQQMVPVKVYDKLMHELKPDGRVPVLDDIVGVWRTATVSALRPAFLVNNIVGQSALLALAHASLKSFRALVQYGSDPALRQSMRQYMGAVEGTGEAAVLGRQTGQLIAGGKLDKAKDFNEALSRWGQAISDDPFRRLAFAMEILPPARKLAEAKGISIHDAMETLMRNDEFADRIERKVLDDLVDFSDMSKSERAIVRRILPFYSWIKGSSRITGRLVLENPLLADLIARTGQEGIKAAEEEFGQLPAFARGILPSSIGSVIPGVGDGKDHRGVITTAQFNPFVTPSDVVGQLGFMVSGGKSDEMYGAQNPLSAINPVGKGVLAAFVGKDPFTGQKIEAEGGAGRFAASVVNAFPQLQGVKKATAEYDGMYRTSPEVELAKYMGLPIRDLNVPKANERATNPIKFQDAREWVAPDGKRFLIGDDGRLYMALPEKKNA
jgi:hypothetical protein